MAKTLYVCVCVCVCECFFGGLGEGFFFSSSQISTKFFGDFSILVLAYIVKKTVKDV